MRLSLPSLRDVTRDLLVAAWSGARVLLGANR